MDFIKKVIKLIFCIVTIGVLVGILHCVYDSYKQKYFNDFSRAELNLYSSSFSRDKEVRYTSNVYSYKITSNNMNDATLYKTLTVEKNTSYKVSCMVKTENVIAEQEYTESGAHLSIIDSLEKSPSIQGTNDWQKIVLYFNSYGRESVNIGARLGGFKDNCTGTAWFSDFKVEKGVVDTDTTWNVACFIIPNTDVVTKDGKEVNVKMTANDIYNTKLNMQRFQNSCKQLSNGLMTATYDVFELNDTLKSISQDEENGYYISGADVSGIIDSYLEKKEYDHIFIVAKLGDVLKNVEVKVNDWIGLGGMTYKGIGFSDIRIPNETYSEIYSYNSVTNTFPEEVLIHEFLHDLERICFEMNYDIPKLHDYKDYGYKNDNVTGQEEWYGAYMTKKIYNNSLQKYIGLESNVYLMKPVHESNFKISREIEFIKEPNNLIEELSQIFTKNYSNIMTKIERQNEVGVLRIK